jgi:hypothetical protein
MFLRQSHYIPPPEGATQFGSTRKFILVATPFVGIIFGLDVG